MQVREEGLSLAQHRDLAGLRLLDLHHHVGGAVHVGGSGDDSSPGGLISGPTQFTICDTALWYLSFTVVGLQPMAVTADLNITFLRPAVGGDLLARAELIRAGRARIFGQVRVWVDGSEDRPVAHATGNYALLESR